MLGKTALGASSPANPALHIPDPLSTTNAATSSSHILIYSAKMTKYPKDELNEPFFFFRHFHACKTQ
jgi:hypothetical protein